MLDDVRLTKGEDEVERRFVGRGGGVPKKGGDGGVDPRKVGGLEDDVCGEDGVESLFFCSRRVRSSGVVGRPVEWGDVDGEGEGERGVQCEVVRQVRKRREVEVGECERGRTGSWEGGENGSDSKAHESSAAPELEDSKRCGMGGGRREEGGGSSGEEVRKERSRSPGPVAG